MTRIDARDKKRKLMKKKGYIRIEFIVKLEDAKAIKESVNRVLNQKYRNYEDLK